MVEWQHRFVRTGWGRLHYIDEGKGEPLVLLHSGGASAWEYDLVFEKLCSHYRVVIWDMPGHGYSDKVTTHHSVEDYTKILVEFLDALNLSKVYVAGVSIGGMITADLAARYSERVRRAVVIEAPFRDDKWYAANWQAFEEMCAFPHVDFDKLAPRFRELTPEFHTRFNMDRSKAGSWTLVDLAWAVRDFNLPAAVAKIRTPLVVMFGDKGPTRACEAQYRELAPAANFKTIKNSGHFPMIDDPAEFAEFLIRADAS